LILLFFFIQNFEICVKNNCARVNPFCCWRTGQYFWNKNTIGDSKTFEKLAFWQVIFMIFLDVLWFLLYHLFFQFSLSIFFLYTSYTNRKLKRPKWTNSICWYRPRFVGFTELLPGFQKFFKSTLEWSNWYIIKVQDSSISLKFHSKMLRKKKYVTLATAAACHGRHSATQPEL